MDDSKKVLYKRINHRIDVRGYCVVYDHELATFGRPKRRSVKSKSNSSKTSPHKMGWPLLFGTMGFMLRSRKLGATKQESPAAQNGHISTSRFETAAEDQATLS